MTCTTNLDDRVRRDTPTPDRGSFRDPRSRVFLGVDGRVLRGLSEEGARDYAAVAATAFLSTAVECGDLVGSEVVDEQLPGPWATVLAHPRVPAVTYPYEWSFSMLTDAAALQLRLLAQGLAHGLMCKDASSYNVQFVGARPVFIDVGSFQPWPDGEPWPGYRQFCQLFLYPLMVEAYLGVDFRPLLRGSVDGIDPATMNGLIRGRARWHRGVFSHVWLHARASDRFAGDERAVADELRAAGVPAAVVRALAAGLERVIDRLEPPRIDTAWTGYGPRDHYPPPALEAKERFVSDVLGRQRWPLVLDLGANDGRFARLAASHADHVVATDVDGAVVDALYRSLRANGPDNVTPLVLDLADPSSGLGWRGRERASFHDRVRPDLVLCLALVHHLAVGRGIPLSEVVNYLASLDAVVVVEAPHAGDPMVRRLAGARPHGVGDYDVDRFESLARRRFTVARTLTLPGIPRTMFELQPRRA